MSDEDLKVRYKKSPEMFTEQDTAQALPEVQAPPESRLGALMRYIRNHPDIRNLKNVSATSLNAPKIKEEVKKVRLFMLKEMAGAKQHDLSDEELEWASKVLGLRIDQAHSVKELLDELEVDCCTRDFNQVLYDVKKVRKGIETNVALAERYPNMVRTDAPSPEQFVGIDRDVGQPVPEVDLEDESGA